MSFLKELPVHTNKRTQFLEITDLVTKAVQESKIKHGICYVYVPHTTAAITINENADQNVAEDIRVQLDKVIPFDDNYKHAEGNSAAHIKASILGFNKIILIDDGKLLLGTWQGIFFCEFDGPRTRKIWVKIIEG